jgi:hypothetical protein
LLLTVSALSFSPSVFAAPRDTAANQKIDEAINNLYLATEFDKAEALLKGVLEACEDRCSPQVKAKAWMYVGIVRGSGKQDIAGAQEAFQQALALDPNVKLDDALATPAVRQAFSSAAAALGQAAPPTKGSKLPETQAGGGGGAVPGNMECTPSVKQVEMQRPIPVACTTDEPATKVTLRYKAFGSETWQQVAMTKKGEYWQGEIPCAETGVAGKMRFYVQAKDKDGEELDNYGTKKEPAEIAIVSRTDEEPPSYPGQAAPQKCMERSSCPPEMLGTPACPGTGGTAARGNKGWGSPCDTSQECDVGLLCTQGDNGRTCETAPSCDSNADCPSGAICKGGTCDIDEASGGEAAAGPFKKNWIGLHAAFDFAYLSGSNVCGSPSDYNCYFSGGTPYTTSGARQNGAPAVKYSGNINGGFATGTIRLLASFERILVGNLGGELRLGFAFNGGPKTPQGQAFLPVHAEVRGKYWFGKNVFSKKGLRPYVHLGGGLAQVDVKLPTTVVDCWNAQTRTADPVCVNGAPAVPPSAADPDGTPAVPSGTGGRQRTLDAYRKLGQGFVTIGGGAMYAFGKNHGLVLNLSFMYMLPSSGIVFEPSLGYVLGL